MKLSPTDRKDIVTALQAGNTTTTQLSSTYKVTRGHLVAVYRKETGLRLTSFKRLSRSEKEAILAELGTNKTTINDIASRYGVTPSAISYLYKKRMGTPLYPQPSLKLSSQDKETILTELRAKKATIGELASTFHVPRSTISKIFRKHTGESFGNPHLPSKTKEAIIAEIRTDDTTSKQGLVDKYGIHIATLERVIKKSTGKTFRSLRPQQPRKELQTTPQEYTKLRKALRQRKYRAWNTQEQKMYDVLGIDWYNQKLLIRENEINQWLDIQQFILMEYTGLKEGKQTPDHPKGREICVGDIVQFPILLTGSDGVTRETIVKDTVTFDVAVGSFLVSELDDPLSLYSDECEIIGTIYENPQMVMKAA